MKGLIDRNAYIIIIFVPTAIYILSYCLFEINAESSLKIKTMILEAIRNHHETNVSMVIEYKLRILWFSSSLLLIIANLIALTWSVAIVCRCYYRNLLIKFSVVGLPILTLALMQIANADSESAMYNNIFDTTYQSLKISTLTSQISIKKVYTIITSINILATITPVFIMFAICSSISMPTESGTPKLEFFIKRMNYLNQGIMIGSAVLLSGIIHMIAWMQWPIAMLGKTDLKNAALNAIATICQYWGISCSLSLIFFMRLRQFIGKPKHKVP